MTRFSFHRYELPGSWIVLAGKSDEDNDQLSLKIAKARDFWFHVKSMPGSHVILQAEDSREPDRETLKLAAGIAAWHSKARQGGLVAVTMARAAHVGKRKGYPPGTVSVKKEKTLNVRPVDPAPYQTEITP